MPLWDISLPVSPGIPTWPGDPFLKMERFKSFEQGHTLNVSRMECCVHTGTHVDAPLHFVRDGAAVEHMALDMLMGTAEVVELADVEAITAAHLEALALPANTTRLLFKTRNSALWKNPYHPFRPDFVALTPDAAAWVVEQGVRLVGVDYLSVESFFSDDALTHRRLLEAGVIIVEGLDLRDITPGSYHLVCLPLKLVGSDGAPARAVLMRE